MKSTDTPTIAPAETVRNRLKSVAHLIRQKGTPDEAQIAAAWEKLLTKPDFDPQKALAA